MMPVKAMKAPVRAKRSKAEMQQEFAEIQEEVESAREAADAKAEGAARLHAAEVRQGACRYFRAAHAGGEGTGYAAGGSSARAEGTGAAP
jgi:hypothetical protein